MHTDTNPTASDNTATRSMASIRRFADLTDLICPGCGEQVSCEPPAFWQVSGAPVAQFSHQDRTALCRTASGVVAEPVEVIR